jgi:hypothetical protein
MFPYSFCLARLTINYPDGVNFDRNPLDDLGESNKKLYQEANRFFSVGWNVGSEGIV